jgi:hypothetical protein
LTVAPKLGAASRVPVFLEMVSPAARVRFPALVNWPLVSVKVPLLARDRAAPSATPPLLFTVRFLKVRAGSVSPLVPLHVMPEVEPPVRDPPVAASEPFSVRVRAPIESAPLVNVRAPVTVASLPRLTPLLLFTVRLGTAPGEVGSSLPVVWAALPLYSRIAPDPYVGVPVTVAVVPCLESVPFTVTPVTVFASVPPKVKLW